MAGYVAPHVTAPKAPKAAPVNNKGAGVHNGQPNGSARGVTTAQRTSHTSASKTGGGGGVRGHWVVGQGGKEQLIHAVGKGKWAPGGVKGFKAPAKPQLAGPGVRINNPLLDPNSNLSGQNLYNAAKGLTDAQVNPVLSGLHTQIANNNKQSQAVMSRAGGYFNQLGQQAAAGNTAEQQAAADLNAQLSQIGQSTQGQIGAAGTQQQGAISQYTPGASDIGAGAHAALAQQIAQQQGLAAQSQGAFQNFGATQGANYRGLAGSEQATNALAGTQAIKGIGQAGQVKNEPLTAQIAAQLAQKGGLLTANLGKLRQQEITNQVTKAGLGIQQANATTARQNSLTSQFNAQTSRRVGLGNLAVARGQLSVQKAKVKLAQQGLNEKQTHDLATQSVATQSLNERTRHDKAAEANQQEAINLRQIATGGKGHVKTFSPGQNATWFRIVDEATSLVGSAQKQGHSAADIKNALETGKLDPKLPALSGLQVEAAYELLGWGALLPKTAATMNAVGIRGGSYKGGPIKVRNGSTGGLTGGVQGAVNGIGSGIAGMLGLK